MLLVKSQQLLQSFRQLILYKPSQFALYLESIASKMMNDKVNEYVTHCENQSLANLKYSKFFS